MPAFGSAFPPKLALAGAAVTATMASVAIMAIATREIARNWVFIELAFLLLGLKFESTAGPKYQRQITRRLYGQMCPTSGPKFARWTANSAVLRIETNAG